MLTQEQIDDLRAAVERVSRRRRGRHIVNYIGGPLDGMRVRDEKLLRPPASLAWCQTTKNGPVVAQYDPTARPASCDSVVMTDRALLQPGTLQMRHVDSIGWLDDVRRAFTTITTTPNEMMAVIHDRMSIVLKAANI